MAEKSKKVLFHLENVKMHFPVKKESIFQRETRAVKAVDGVTLDIYQGETLGLVGESGCGKTTLGRMTILLHNPTDGRIQYFGLTLDDYAPAYVYKAVRRYQSMSERDPEKLIQSSPEEVAIFGGLLLSDDRASVAQIMQRRLNAVSRLYKAKTEIALLDFARGEANSTEKGDRRHEALSGTIRSIDKEIESFDESLGAARIRISDRPGFCALEEKRSEGINIAKLTGDELRRLRRHLQIVFQDPYSSLNPRLTMGNIVSEALVAHEVFQKNSSDLEDYTLKVMADCGLQNYMLHRYPHQFSGGQRQRIGIARALALKPKFVVCDEAVSALDVSIQSQIINLLMDLKEQNNLTYLFISHDMSAVKFISDRVGVMYLGNIIELGESQSIYDDPLHPYTEALLNAIPTTTEDSKKELQILEGDIPSPVNPPSGCKFHTRCRYATDKCKAEYPAWREHKPGHFVACHYPLNNGDKES